jgi:hypothetical protein
MREAARALDDVSDHLGEVLRRADDLLAEWSKFGGQVRAQVEREAAAVGEVVEGAIGRAAAAGIDRAIGDRLRALTVELERLEQRTRAASRAVVEQRDGDRRILWAVVAGIVLANALLVVVLLRRPEAAPVAEPIRMDAPATQPAEAAPGTIAGSAGAGAGSAAVAPGAAPGAGSSAGLGGAAVDAISGPGAGPPGAGAGSGSAVPGAAGKPAAAGSGARPAEPASKASPIALPPRPGAAHPHKKLP